MDICDSTIAFTTKCDIPGRLRVKTTITHQVERPLSEKNIDPWQFYIDSVLKFLQCFREAAEAKAAAEQSQAASSLPPEPDVDCGKTLANIRSVVIL